MNPPTLPNDLAVLQKQVHDLRVAVNLFWTLAILVLAAFVFSAFTFAVPKFEKIFDDMIPGGRDKLPLLTQAIIYWCRMFPLPQLLVVVLTIGGTAGLWALRSTGYACLVAMLVCVLLAAQWVAFVLGCFLPLISVITNLGSA